ncbi:MAG: hypothetical protein IJX80_08910 [Clostridia bacterium]|nr:hypothetical protein [Clostridia bacterium]
MKFKVRYRLGLLWSIPAALFLFEPVVAFSDVLPNWIGYLILYLCLGQLADLNGRIEESRSNFKKMIWVGLGSAVMQYYLYHVISGIDGKMNAYETPMWILLCSFVVLILQCIFLLPAYRELFLGFGVLAEQYGDEHCLASRRGKTRYERMATFSAVFVIVTSVLSVLPELSLLTSFEYEDEKLPFDWYQFIGLFRTVAGFVMTVLGCIWLIRFIITVSAAARDKQLMKALTERYASEMLPKTGILILRRVRFAFGLMMLAMIFTVNVRMDSKMLLPSGLCAILFCAAIPILGDFAKGRPFFLCAAAVLLATSVAQKLLCDRFLEAYSVFEMSRYHPDAYLDFLTLRLVEVVDAMVVFVLMWMMLRSIRMMISAETAEVYDNDHGGVSRDATDRLHRRFHIRIYISGVLCFMSALAKALESYFQLQYPWLWWVAMPLTVISAIFFITLLYAVIDQLEWQYSSYGLNKMPESDAYLHCNPNLQKGVQQYAEQQSKQESEQSESEQSESEQSEQESE